MVLGHSREATARAREVRERCVKSRSINTARLLKSRKEAARKRVANAARDYTNQKQVTERLIKAGGKNPTTAEKILRLVLARGANLEKNTGKAKASILQAGGTKIATLWKNTASMAEHNFLQLNAQEVARIRRGEANLHTVEEKLRKGTQELYKRARSEEEGTVIANALYRAFSIWQEAAGSVESQIKAQQTRKREASLRKS